AEEKLQALSNAGSHVRAASGCGPVGRRLRGDRLARAFRERRGRRGHAPGSGARRGAHVALRPQRARAGARARRHGTHRRDPARRQRPVLLGDRTRAAARRRRRRPARDGMQQLSRSRARAGVRRAAALAARRRADPHRLRPRRPLLQRAARPADRRVRRDWRAPGVHRASSRRGRRGPPRQRRRRTRARARARRAGPPPLRHRERTAAAHHDARPHRRLRIGPRGLRIEHRSGRRRPGRLLARRRDLGDDAASRCEHARDVRVRAERRDGARRAARPPRPRRRRPGGDLARGLRRHPGRARLRSDPLHGAHPAGGDGRDGRRSRARTAERGAARPPRARRSAAARQHRPAGALMLDLRIERVETLPVALPTRATFAVSGGSVARAGEPSVRVLVKVTASDGTFGWGEATPIPSWTYETLESIATTIDRYLAPVARAIAVWDTDALARAFDRAINRGFSIGAPLAKAAVDVAVHDVLGKALSLPVYALLGGLRAERIPLGWIVSTEGAGGAE